MSRKISVIITAFKEPQTLPKALQRIVEPNKALWENLQVLVVSPDAETRAAAHTYFKNSTFDNFQILEDAGMGKAAALNLAYEKTTGDFIFFTDGDMYCSENFMNVMLGHFDDAGVAGVCGRPVSLETRDSMFGYFSHLFCEAAHSRRLNNHDKKSYFIPLSGYLMVLRRVEGLFPLPENLKAEDAYITAKLYDKGYSVAYEPNALAYVYFPKNLKDWLAQKTRSLGGNVQLALYEKGKEGRKNSIDRTRTLWQDFGMILFPLSFCKNFKEFFYSLVLYPIRLYLWLRIYYIHLLRRYPQGTWQRIESSKY